MELFQLMRSDFEAVLERYPLLRSRLTKIGQVRPERRLRKSAACRSRCEWRTVSRPRLLVGTGAVNTYHKHTYNTYPKHAYNTYHKHTYNTYPKQ